MPSGPSAAVRESEKRIRELQLENERLKQQFEEQERAAALKRRGGQTVVVRRLSEGAQTANKPAAPRLYTPREMELRKEDAAQFLTMEIPRLGKKSTDGVTRTTLGALVKDPKLAQMFSATELTQALKQGKERILLHYRSNEPLRTPKNDSESVELIGYDQPEAPPSDTEAAAAPAPTAGHAPAAAVQPTVAPTPEPAVPVPPVSMPMPMAGTPADPASIVVPPSGAGAEQIVGQMPAAPPSAVAAEQIVGTAPTQMEQYFMQLNRRRDGRSRSASSSSSSGSSSSSSGSTGGSDSSRRGKKRHKKAKKPKEVRICRKGFACTLTNDPQHLAEWKHPWLTDGSYLNNSTKLFAGNLHLDVTEDELRDHFGAVGQIKEVRTLLRPLHQRPQSEEIVFDTENRPALGDLPVGWRGANSWRFARSRKDWRVASPVSAVHSTQAFLSTACCRIAARHEQGHAEVWSGAIPSGLHGRG